MVKTWMTILALALLCVTPAWGEASYDGAAAFEELKALVGSWHGNAMAADGPEADFEFQLTAGGSVLIERQFVGSDHEMVSVYHLDGDDLVMTHYCAAGNQPRMRLDATASKPGELHFVFDGGSNMNAEKDGHIHSARIRLPGEDKIESEWDFYSGGKKDHTNKTFLARVE